jgi:hypothetical protein
LHLLRANGFHHALAAGTTQSTNPNHIANTGPQHLAQVNGTAIVQQHAVGIDPIGSAQQNEVHRIEINP